jgi:hypothetical protein
MEARSFFSKRWFGFFLLLFVVWYPIMFLLMTMQNLFEKSLFLFAGNIFTSLWMLLVSYWYFRFAPNTWMDRCVTALGWVILLFLISVLLVKPVYGYAWQSMFTLDVIDVYWVHVAAIFVGGLVAHTSTMAQTKTPAV